jgi:hypothetical protein
MIARGLAWVGAVTILILSVVPADERPVIGVGQAVEHLTAFGLDRVWSTDVTLLSNQQSIIPYLEQLYADRLLKYARFLLSLDIKPPYHWIGGLTGVKDRRLAPGPGQMVFPGGGGPLCLSDTVSEEGHYDGQQTQASTLHPLFKMLFDKCGIARSD